MILGFFGMEADSKTFWHVLWDHAERMVLIPVGPRKDDINEGLIP
jgi:hypothetical protein